VRWRRIDLKRVIAERFGVDYHARYVTGANSRARTAVSWFEPGECARK
jgi:hypothetical protein